MSMSSPPPNKKRKTDTKSKGKDGEFKIVHAQVALPIPPIFGQDARAGILEMLDSMIMRYIPSLRGVVLGHDNVTIVDIHARLIADNPYAICTVAFDATTWSPAVGMKLTGKVSVCSPDHISLLAHRTFNVAIPRHHIPLDTFEFEQVDQAENETNDEPKEETGRWIDKLTASPVQDKDGNVSFTVVGVKLSNQMISLVGSIQPDPFSETHVAAQGIETEKGYTSESTTAALPKSATSDPDNSMDGHDVESEPPIMNKAKNKRKKGRELDKRIKVSDKTTKKMKIKETQS